MLRNIIGLRHSLIISLLVIIVYLPGLSGGFIYDDYFNFLHNPAITDGEFSLEGLWSAINSGVSGPSGRPIPMLSFYINYKLSGVSPFGYKIFNLLIHLVNSIMVYFILLNVSNLLFSRGSKLIKQSQINSIVLWSTIIWATHPINLTGVLYVVQRMTTMSATFVFAGILAYIKLRSCKSTRQTLPYFIGILLFGVLAILCKENGVLLFLFILVTEVFIYQGFFNNKKQKQYVLLFFSAIFSFLILLTVYMLIKGGINLDFGHRDFSLEERLLTQSRVIWFYISQIVIPQVHIFGLHHDDFSLSTSLLNPFTTFLSIIGICGAIVITFLTRKKYPWLGFGILFFLVGHLIESTVLPLNMIHEHRNYIPSIGIILIFVTLLTYFITKVRFIHANIIFILFAGIFSTITISRAYDWGNMIRFADTIVDRHPNSINSNYEAGFIYMKTYEYTNDRYYLDKAIMLFHNADRLSVNSIKSAVSLVHVLSVAGIEQDVELINKINNSLADKQIKIEEIIALRQLVRCRLESECILEDSIIIGFFNELLSNPSLSGRFRDDSLYIYATYLDVLPDMSRTALNILRDIVARNPDILEYKVQLIKLLLANGNENEAIEIMEDLSKHHGYKWNLIQN